MQLSSRFIVLLLQVMVISCGSQETQNQQSEPTVSQNVTQFDKVANEFKSGQKEDFPFFLEKRYPQKTFNLYTEIAKSSRAPKFEAAFTKVIECASSGDESHLDARMIPFLQAIIANRKFSHGLRSWTAYVWGMLYVRDQTKFSDAYPLQVRDFLVTHSKAYVRSFYLGLGIDLEEVPEKDEKRERRAALVLLSSKNFEPHVIQMMRDATNDTELFLKHIKQLPSTRERLDALQYLSDRQESRRISTRDFGRFNHVFREISLDPTMQASVRGRAKKLLYRFTKVLR